MLNDPNLTDAIRSMSISELNELAKEIRAKIIEVVPKTGGHMGTNLGVVELTLALYKNFDFLEDKLVFDVGHQAYPHKLITGRAENFHTLRQKDGVCGFPSPWESPYDNFLTGHAGTSISSALGLALGYEAQAVDKKIVAIIGDGSICGLSFEGLNQVGALKKNILVILNDNKMAISPTVGAFSKYLNRVRSGELYHNLIRDFKQGLHHIPMIGDTLEQMGERALIALRDNLLPDHFFTELGFTYFGPADGHDLDELSSIIHNLKDINEPVLLHVLTEKGKGALGAEKDPYKFHSPPSVGKKAPATTIAYSQCFVDSLIKQAEINENIFAITAAMAQGTKLEGFIKKYPHRAVDTGIAEAHAVTMAGGMEYTGIKPVVLIYSTFLQRAYDSIMHDVCLQKRSGVIFALDRAGLVGDDGPSHHGVFDIAYCRHLPKMIVMAPRDGDELDMMFQWALEQDAPIAIRYPRGNVPNLQLDPAPAIELGKPEVLKRGQKIAIMAYGAMVEEALQAVRQLEEEGINATFVNMRFAKPLCKDAYAPILEEHDYIITLEDHVLMGGVGSAVLELINEEQLKTGEIIRMGIPDEFVTYAKRAEQLESLGMDAKGIVEKVHSLLHVPVA